MAQTSPPFDSHIHLCTKTPSEEETRSINEFREQLKSSSKYYTEFQDWLTNPMLQRFLIARQYNQTKSFKLIEQALEWRKSRNPNRFLPRPSASQLAKFEHEMKTGKTYIAGFDRWGRVVIVFNNSVQNTAVHEDQMDFLSWLLEIAILISPSHADKYVIFMHLDTFSFFNCPPMKTTRETILMLTTAFPERLGHMICYQPPTVFHTVFHSLKPWIDPRTSSKMVFIYGSIQAGSENDALMSELVGDKWRELTGAGGTADRGCSPGYEHRRVWVEHLGYVERVGDDRLKGSSGSVVRPVQPTPHTPHTPHTPITHPTSHTPSTSTSTTPPHSLPHPSISTKHLGCLLIGVTTSLLLLSQGTGEFEALWVGTLAVVSLSIVVVTEGWG